MEAAKENWKKLRFRIEGNLRFFYIHRGGISESKGKKQFAREIEEKIRSAHERKPWFSKDQGSDAADMGFHFDSYLRTVLVITRPRFEQHPEQFYPFFRYLHGLAETVVNSSVHGLGSVNLTMDMNESASVHARATIRTPLGEEYMKGKFLPSSN